MVTYIGLQPSVRIIKNKKEKANRDSQKKKITN